MSIPVRLLTEYRYLVAGLLTESQPVQFHKKPIGLVLRCARQSIKPDVTFRLCKEIALHQPSAHPGQNIALAFAFDAFKNTVDAKVLAHIKYCLHNAAAALAMRYWGHEDAVDLKHIKFQLVDIAQTGIADTEIIKGDTRAVLAQVPDACAGRFEIAQERGFGNLER